jgi:hypothetical protein
MSQEVSKTDSKLARVAFAYAHPKYAQLRRCTEELQRFAEKITAITYPQYENGIRICVDVGSSLKFHIIEREDNKCATLFEETYAFKDGRFSLKYATNHDGRKRRREVKLAAKGPDDVAGIKLYMLKLVMRELSPELAFNLVNELGKDQAQTPANAATKKAVPEGKKTNRPALY